MTSFLDAALTWEGTAWAPSGAVRGRRSNCIGFLVRALEAAGYEDLAEQARPWISHEAPPEAFTLSLWCDEHLLTVSPDSAEPGDLVLLRFKGTPCHMALVTEPGVILDCNSSYGKVCRHSIPTAWTLRGVYRLP